MIRVAAFQRVPVYDDDARVAALLVRDMIWADAHGVDLAVFPECVVRGHAYDAPTIAARAMAADDPALRAILDRLAGFCAMAVIGFFERRGDVIHNSAALVVGGRVAGIYAKMRPNEGGIAAGRDDAMFACGNIRFGINICNDANDPCLAASLAAGGAAAIVYPLNNMLPVDVADRWRSRSIANVRDRARETGCWTVSADVVGRCGTRISHGCTMIADPYGTVRSRVAEGQEGVAMCDIA